MAEFTKVPQFVLERGNENSMDPKFIDNRGARTNHGVHNEGMFRRNNQNFLQVPIPHDRPTPFLRSGFSETNMSNSNRQNMPPYLQCSPWPPNWNMPAFSSHHQGFYPATDPNAAISFRNSVPPPPRISNPSTLQQSKGSQGVDAGETSAGVCEPPGSIEANDQMWINGWIRCQPRQETTHSPSTIQAKTKVKVWEVKQLLQSCMSVLDELEALEGELKARWGEGEMDVAGWEGKMREAEGKKVLLSKSLGVLNEGVLLSTRSALLKRGRKRARLKVRRAVDRETLSVRMEKRRRLHLEADSWLGEKQAEVELHKREELLKQEADAVLWEVRRKQSEGRRILSLLSALVKLHHVRVRKSDPASNPGLSDNDDQFQIIIDKVRSLWERQMLEYEAEERALRVMLQERPEGGGEGGVREKARGDLQRNLRIWESQLFGVTGSQDLPSWGRDSSCQWLHLLPSKCLQALTEKRRQWDQFISTSTRASAIPVGWVIPAEASSEEWRALIGSHGEIS